MHLSTFLSSVADDNFIATQKVFGFKGVEFPLLFFNHFKRLLQHKSVTVQSVDVQADVISVQSQLGGSFLGQEIFYWFGDLSILDARKKRYWLDYISSYAGPHKIGFFIDEEEASQLHAVEIPALVTETLYRDLQAISAFDATPPATLFTKKLFSASKNISLDMACLLLEYQNVLGTGTQLFFDSWLKKLLIAEKSLFILAQHFFAKSPKPFLSLWEQIRHDYPDVFWVTFWSEQVWRAYYVVQLYKEKKLIEAKKMAYRLPFSFVQKDWRIASCAELRNAHQFLYTLDFNLKNGATESSLELFFIKFFVGHFGR